MSDTKEITWPETIAYRITNALRFSGIIDDDNYIVEQKARNEITPIIRRWCIPIERIEDWQARAEAAENELSAVRFAAQMPDDYKYGLSSWIHQYLYAAYIGAEIPRSVLERVATGALIFPEAPIYAEYKRLQGRVQELEAQLAAQAWRPVTGDDMPEDHDEVLITAELPDGFLYVTTAEYTCDGSWWWVGGGDTFNRITGVTHWQPLPAPPQDTPARPGMKERNDG